MTPVRRAATMAVLACMVCCAVAEPMMGQGGTGAFRGTVTRDSSRIPIEGVEVTMEGVGTVLASRTGRFAFASVAPGLYTVRIRHMGYKPIEGSVQIAQGETKDLTFAIWPLTTNLPGVEVRANAAPLNTGMVDFERRRAQGLGKFLTSTDFEGRDNATLADVFGSTPGLIVDRLANGRAVAASRRSTNTSFRPMNTPGADPSKCYMQIFVDGLRIWRPHFDQLNEPPNLNEFSVSQIAGVEIYLGAAETPVEFGGTSASCGTIVIWTGRRR